MPSFDLLAFPFAAGLVAAFNPCGFAMLPTYLTYFLGLEDENTSVAKSVLRGASVGSRFNSWRFGYRVAGASTLVR